MPTKTWSGLAGKAAVLVILVCVGALVAGSAGAAAKHGPSTATIKIKQKPSGKPYFDVPGDGNISASELKIVNKTNPHQIGPHTFSLVTAESVPSGRDEKKDCGKLKPNTMCAAIADWHDVGPPPDFEIGTPMVEAGGSGWDTAGDLNNTGDSQFLSKKDQSFTRTLTNNSPPVTFHFMCAVHPEMHGKFTFEGI